MKDMLADVSYREHIGDELADQFFFLLRIADLYGFDLSAELQRKIAKNNEKYPIDESYGSNRKATQ